MIQEFLTYDLRNSEYLQFSKSFANIIVRNNPELLRITPQLTLFQAGIAEGDALFVLPRESGLTADVVAQDTRRDTNLRGLTQVIRGYLNHFDPAFRNAALLLDKNIRLYGSQVYNQNYQSESNIITNMTTDWQETTALADALELLGLREWSNELRTSNDAFIELYVLRTQEFGARTKDKLRDKRLEIDAAYLQLVTVLNARAVLDEANTYITVVNELNSLIDQTQATLHNRQARGDNDEEDDTPSAE